MNLKEKTSLWHVVILRVYIGYYLLYQGIRKFLRDFPGSDWVSRQIGDLDKVELYSWYESFLRDVVIPNRQLFGQLVTWGEILVGACLLAGFLTRFSSVVGLFMLVNYFLGPGMARGGASMGQIQTFIVALLIILLSNPGRTLGVDSFLFKRR